MKREKYISFAVKSRYFSVYEAFKTEMERIGYTWNSEFNEFNTDRFERSTCVYISDDWNPKNKDVPMMSFSNPSYDTEVFDLDKGFVHALEHARLELLRVAPPPKQVQLNDHYVAEVTSKKVTVGCQTFSGHAVKELYDAAVEMGLIR